MNARRPTAVRKLERVATVRAIALPAIAMPAPAPAFSLVRETPRPLVDLADLDVVNEVLGGHREKFEIIVRRYHAPLHRLVVELLCDPAHAEEAMQDAYLKAFFHLGRFQSRASFSTWLKGLMVSECLVRLHRCSRSLDERPAGASPPRL